MGNYSIKIYKATEINIDDMTWIFNDSIKIFPSNIRRDSDRNQLSDVFNTNNVFIVERMDISKKIGWIAYKINEDHVFISGLYVLIDEQYKGVGTKILNYCINTLWKDNFKIITLNALKCAPWSIEFYKKNNFLIYDETVEYGKDLMFLKTKEVKDWEIIMYKYLINNIEINEITQNKEKYMDLLLLGDEQENMIKKYLYRGKLFALYDGDLKTVSVVTKEDESIYEIKNIATYEKYQGNGYGKTMIKYIIEKYKNKCNILLVGTGDNDKTISFYRNCGFEYSHTVNDFFINNYEHEIFEDRKQLKDMIYLKIEFIKDK